MTLRTLAIGIGVACLAWPGFGAGAAAGATHCVGSAPGCFAGLQAAVDASHDGDSIRIAPGSFAGGVSIAKSLRLVGAGADATVIRGGGPALTIGVFGADHEPTVSIRGVRVTGGVTHSSPVSTAFVGADSVIALGGGIEVPPAAGFAAGATLRIDDTVITDNRAAPTATVPFGPPCPSGPCPFASAGGGGIDNWGATTLTDTVVTDNHVGGPVAADAEGAGIHSDVGSLTLVDSTVRDNSATAAAPNGRHAVGGGVFIQGGDLAVRRSLIGDNAARLTSTLPAFAGGALIDLGAVSGGIFLSDDAAATVEDSAITRNTVNATDLLAEPIAIDAAMNANASPVVIRRSVISGNRVASTVGTSFDTGPGGSALELDGGGTISDTLITGNTSATTSPAGAAATNGALAVLNFNGDPQLVAVRDSVISDNDAIASSTTGSATVQGGGVFNDSLLALDRTVVRDNHGRATAASGTAQGGGIRNGAELNPPPVELHLTDSVISGNTLTASPGIPLQGGGLYTTEPFTRARTLIAGNTPDQCFGCSAGSSSASDPHRRGGALAVDRDGRAARCATARAPIAERPHQALCALDLGRERHLGGTTAPTPRVVRTS